MGFTNPDAPNLTDFLSFLSDSVQIPTAALPTDSPYPQYALTQAIGLVINPTGATYPGVMYSLAVYNCATHILFVITPDQSGQTYFASARGNNSSTTPPGFALNAPSTGIVVASSDQGTSSTLSAPDWASGLTVGQLDFYKTPWGRWYLSWNQSFGPTVVGLT